MVRKSTNRIVYAVEKRRRITTNSMGAHWVSVRAPDSAQTDPEVYPREGVSSPIPSSRPRWKKERNRMRKWTPVDGS